MKLRLSILVILLSLSLAACSLAEDITPPPNYVAPTAQPTSAPTIAVTQTTNPPSATATPIPTSTTVATNPGSAAATTSSSTTPGEVSPTAQSGVGTTPAATSATTPLAVVSPTVQPSMATVSGTITVASGAAIPDGTIASLLVYDTSAGKLTQTLTTPILTDGKYEFSNVPADTNTVFLTTVDYRGVTYDSAPKNFDGTITQYDLPVTVYETSTDLTVLTITQAHLQFDFSTTGTVQVMVLYVISNPGSNAITVTSDGGPEISWWVALRALVWSALFVGIVAVYIPTMYFALTPSRAWIATPAGVVGLLGIVAGGLVMVACVAEFATRGRGTPAPIDPPRQLVVRGPYRFVRNPMYLGMVLVLLGELSLAFSRGFAGYIAGWFACMHLLVVLYEEPTLRRKFGVDYERYTREVGRWWPSFGKRQAPASAEGPTH